MVRLRQQFGDFQLESAGDSFRRRHVWAPFPAFQTPDVIAVMVEQMRQFLLGQSKFKAVEARKARERQPAGTENAKKTFPFAIGELIADCNNIAASRNLDLSYRKQKTDAISARYFVNDPEHMLITFMTEDGKRFRAFFMIARGDGTLESVVDLLGSCIFLLRALESDLTQEEAASRFVEMFESVKSGKLGKYVGRNGSYTLSHTDSIGLIFGGDPN